LERYEEHISEGAGLRWLLASLLATVVPVAGVFAGLLLPGPRALLWPAAAVAVATVLVNRLIVPVIRTNDRREFLKFTCLVIPFTIAGTILLIGLLVSATLHSLNTLPLNRALLPTFLAFLLSFAVACPLALLCWARKSRRTDPSRCDVCGYRIDNIPGPRCPECGTVFLGPASRIEEATGRAAGAPQRHDAEPAAPE